MYHISYNNNHNNNNNNNNNNTNNNNNDKYIDIEILILGTPKREV